MEAAPSSSNDAAWTKIKCVSHTVRAPAFNATLPLLCIFTYCCWQCQADPRESNLRTFSVSSNGLTYCLNRRKGETTNGSAAKLIYDPWGQPWFINFQLQPKSMSLFIWLDKVSQLLQGPENKTSYCGGWQGRQELVEEGSGLTWLRDEHGRYVLLPQSSLHIRLAKKSV